MRTPNDHELQTVDRVNGVIQAVASPRTHMKPTMAARRARTWIVPEKSTCVPYCVAHSLWPAERSAPLHWPHAPHEKVAT
jgi:hypothetical protein